MYENCYCIYLQKQKNGDISDVGNYRPVSLATIISKVIEPYILSCISPLVAIIDNQFGFKPQRDTDMCAFYSNGLCIIM